MQQRSSTTPRASSVSILGHRLRSPESASRCVHSRRSRPMHTTWFVQPEVRCRCRRPRHRPSDRHPNAPRNRGGTHRPRLVSIVIPCSPTGPRPGARQELLGLHPSRRSRCLSNTTTAPLLPATSSSECRAAPVPTETSQLHPSWHGPSGFESLPDPGRSAAGVQVDNRCVPPQRCPSQFADPRAGIAVLPIRLPQPVGSAAVPQLVIALLPDPQSFLDLPVHSRYSCS